MAVSIFMPILGGGIARAGLLLAAVKAVVSFWDSLRVFERHEPLLLLSSHRLESVYIYILALAGGIAN